DSITTRAGAGTVLGLFLIRLEEDRRERRQRQGKRVTVLLVGHRHGIGAAVVAQAAAAVARRVAVEDLAPVAAAGHANPVVEARHRGEVEDREDRRRVLSGEAQERDRALL